MTALQLGYLTSRRKVVYSATEACLLFTRSRRAVLPYGYVRAVRLLRAPRLGAPAPTAMRNATHMIKIILALAVILTAGLPAQAQQTTIRDGSGRITGTVTTDSNGTKTYRDGSGRMTGTATTASNGTTTFRDASGRTTGTASGPRR
jgi:YD repeat-containing protein